MKINSENLNINLRHLRAIQMIAQERSFSAAASRLGVVPSALSELVRQMEEAIGAPLFDRTVRPAALTPLARDFIEDTSPMLAGLDRAVTRLRQNADLEQGALALGASPSAISELVGPALAAYHHHHPGIRCVLHDDIAENLAQMVADGRLDLAVAGRARHSADLHQRAIMQDPVGLACHANHPLTRKSGLRLDDIPPRAVIGLNPDTGTHHLLSHSGQIPPALLEPNLSAHSTIAQLCMIRARMGVALLPRNAVQLFRDPQICFLPIADLDLWRQLYLLEPARRARSHAALSFVGFLDARLTALPDISTP